MKKILHYVLLPLALLLTFYFGGLYFFQEYLYLNPDKVYMSPQQAKTPEFKEKVIRTRTGVQMMTWYAEGQKNKPAILFFHGNRGQIATVAPHLSRYVTAGYTVMIPEYQGYAETKGKFTQDNVYRDGVHAYDYLKKQGHTEIFVFGYSMGTSVATFVASQKRAYGLILAAPFYSLKKLVSEKQYPFAELVLKNEMPTDSHIRKYYNPTLIIHGEEDTLIPSYHGKELFVISPAKDKKLTIVPRTNHGDLFFTQGGHLDILKWIKEHERVQSTYP
ncbi:MAG: alpha/beta hydrolase [Alphaproteobacteria bacterium]|nr:alpha/beta hydrolase [Alphaproteobacteria bacterium]